MTGTTMLSPDQAMQEVRELETLAAATNDPEEATSLRRQADQLWYLRREMLLEYQRQEVAVAFVQRR